MQIRERPEMSLLTEGVQVSRTNRADYFYFVHSGDILMVRLPKDKSEMVTAEVKSFSHDATLLPRE